jgi:small subunit ribosomal protein S20
VKRNRLARKARVRNVAEKSKIKSQRRDLFAAFEAGNLETSAQSYREYCSILDKAVKRGIITRNTAIRRKTRAANRMRKLGAAPKPA